MYIKRLMLLSGSVIIALVFAGCVKNQISNEYINLRSYEKVEIKNRKILKITEEDIDEYIDEVRLRNAKDSEIKEGAVQKGDVVNVDFRGEINGKEFEGGTEKGYIVTVGLGEIIEGFDENIIGHFVGDTFEFESKFPKDYYDVGFAGEQVVFEIKVNSINRQKIPELNDKFVKTVSDTSKTVKEYREEVKEILEASNQLESQLEDEIWQTLMEKTKVKTYPKKEKEKQKDLLKKEYEKMALSYGMTYEEFVKKEMESTEKEFDSQIEKQAEEVVKEKLLVQAIAKEEKICVPKEREELLEELVKETGFENKEMLKREIGKEKLENMLLKKMVKKWLLNNCIVGS